MNRFISRKKTKQKKNKNKNKNKKQTNIFCQKAHHGCQLIEKHISVVDSAITANGKAKYSSILTSHLGWLFMELLCAYCKLEYLDYAITSELSMEILWRYSTAQQPPK